MKQEYREGPKAKGDFERHDGSTLSLLALKEKMVVVGCFQISRYEVQFRP